MRKLLLASIILVLTCLLGAQAPMKLGTPSPDDVKTLSKAQKDYTESKGLYHRHATPKNRQAYVIATVRYGTTSMMSAALPPKTKYRQALQLYREALKLDPKNNEAKSNSDLIISIYRSMHRPVPN